MKTLSVVAILVTWFLLCSFQQEASSRHQKTAPQVGSADKQKADSKKEPQGGVSRGQPPTDAADKNATPPTARRQNDKVEVASLPPEIAVKQVKDSIDRTVMWCTVVHYHPHDCWRHRYYRRGKNPSASKTTSRYIG